MEKTLPRSLHHIRGSVILLALRVFGVLFVPEIVYTAALVFLYSYIPTLDNYPTVIAGLLVLQFVKFVLQAYVVLHLVITWATTIFYLTDEELLRFRGVLRVDEAVYDLKSLRGLAVHQSWIGKLLNYGDIYAVISSSGYREDVWLRGIADPKRYEHVINAHMESVAAKLANGKTEPNGVTSPQIGERPETPEPLPGEETATAQESTRDRDVPNPEEIPA